MADQDLIALLRELGYTPEDIMNANVGLEGYTKGVGVLQNGVDIFDINQDGRVSSQDAIAYARAPVQEPSSLANLSTTTAENYFDYEDLNKDGIVTQEELDESGRLEEEDFYNSPYYQSMDFPKYFDPATGETQYEEIYSELLNGAAYTKNDGSFNLIDAWKNWSGSGEKKRIEQEASYVYDRVVNDATMYGEEAYFDGHVAQQFYEGEGGYGSSNTFGVGGSSYANRFTDRQIFNYLVAAEGIETKKDFDPTPFFEGVTLPEGSEIRQGVGLKGPYASNYSAIKLRDDERGGNLHRIDTNPSAPIGSYTIVDIFVPDPPDPTLLENVTALMDVVSFIYPPLKLISTAVKLVDGQEISAIDIIGSIGVGMDIAGIKPPDFGLDSIEFEAAVQADVDEFIDINSGILDRVGGIAEVEKFEAATRSAILAQQVLPPNFADFTNPVVDGFLDVNLDADKTIGVMDIIDMAEGVKEAMETPPAFDIDGVPTGAMGSGVIVNFGSDESLGNYNPVKDKYTGKTIISDGYGNTISEIGQVINAAGDVIRQLDKESSQNLSEATIDTVRDKFANSEEWVDFNAVSPDVQDGQVSPDVQDGQVNTDDDDDDDDNDIDLQAAIDAALKEQETNLTKDFETQLEEANEAATQAQAEAIAAAEEAIRTGADEDIAEANRLRDVADKARSDLEARLGSPAVEDDPSTEDIDESKAATGVYATFETQLEEANEAATQAQADAVAAAEEAIRTGADADIAEANRLKNIAEDALLNAEDARSNLEAELFARLDTAQDSITDLETQLGSPAVEDDPSTEDIDESKAATGVYATFETQLEEANEAATQAQAEAIAAAEEAIRTGADEDIAEANRLRDVADKARSDLEARLGSPAVEDDPSTEDIDESKAATGVYATFETQLEEANEAATQAQADAVAAAEEAIRTGADADIAEANRLKNIAEDALLNAEDARSNLEAELFAELGTAQDSITDLETQLEEADAAATQAQAEAVAAAEEAIRTRADEDIAEANRLRDVADKARSDLEARLGSPAVEDDPSTEDIDESKAATGVYATFETQLEEANEAATQAQAEAIAAAEEAIRTGADEDIAEANRLRDVADKARSDLEARLGSPAVEDDPSTEDIDESKAATGVYATFETQLEEANEAATQAQAEAIAAAEEAIRTGADEDIAEANRLRDVADKARSDLEARLGSPAVEDDPSTEDIDESKAATGVYATFETQLEEANEAATQAQADAVAAAEEAIRTGADADIAEANRLKNIAEDALLNAEDARSNLEAELFAELGTAQDSITDLETQLGSPAVEDDPSTEDIDESKAATGVYATFETQLEEANEAATQAQADAVAAAEEAIRTRADADIAEANRLKNIAEDALLNAEDARSNLEAELFDSITDLETQLEEANEANTEGLYATLDPDSGVYTVVDNATGEIVFSSQPDLPEGEDETYEINNSVDIEADPVLITDPSDSEGGGGTSGDTDGGVDSEGDGGTSGDTDGGVDSEGDGVGGTSETTDEGVLLRQLYQAASEESDENLREALINEYIKLGGIFGDDLREGVPYDITYPNPTYDETTLTNNPDGTYTIVDNATGEIIYESNPATATGEEEATNIPITYPDLGGEVADGPDSDSVINEVPSVISEPSDGGDGDGGGDSTVITEPSDGDGDGDGSGSGSGDGDGDGSGSGSGSIVDYGQNAGTRKVKLTPQEVSDYYLYDFESIFGNAPEYGKSDTSKDSPYGTIGKAKGGLIFDNYDDYDDGDELDKLLRIIGIDLE